MKTRKCLRCLLGSTRLALAAGGGCGGSSPSNLSPTAENSPERHQRALKDVQEKARKDQEDERQAFRRSGQSMPKP